MGVVSLKQTSRKPVRSFTFPNCRSHPRTERIENLLNMFKNWEYSALSSPTPSAEMICSGLSHLKVIYKCLEDLIKTNLYSNHTTKCTDEMLDLSIKFLDICSNTTDVISRVKQELRDFGCDLRRNGLRCIETIISKYIVFRSKLKKDIKQSMATLKRVENTIQNDHLLWEIGVFRDVAACTTVIFRFLLEFLGVPLLKTKRDSRWKGVSRLLSGASKVVPEQKDDTNVNQLQKLDAVVFRNNTTSEKQEFIKKLQNKVEACEATLEDITCHMELLPRRLIATRVSLLNMISFY